MSRHSVSPLLRFALRLDAVASLATGIALVLFFNALAALFALPATLLLGAGVFCVGYALAVGNMSRRPALPGWTVWAVIGGNVLWSTECLLLAFGDSVAPTAPGKVFLLVQAVAVFTFAELQWFGLRRSGAATNAVAA